MMHPGRSLIFAWLLVIVPPTCTAQIDTVIPNRKAVPLRVLWFLSGEGGRVGIGYRVGGIGDMNFDGFEDFGVGDFSSRVQLYFGDANGGARSPFRVFMQRGLVLPASGDFWGTGRRTLTLGAPEGILEFYEVTSQGLSDTPRTRWEANTDEGYYPFRALDLDLDGYDDLIMRHHWNVAFRIYRGGPSFPRDTPDVVIRDSGGFDMNPAVIADLDGDSYPDLAASVYSGTERTLRIWWGGPRIELLDRPPDVVRLFAYQYLFSDDLDGDGAADIICPPGIIYLSGSGKSARTRSWDSSDADLRRRAGGLYLALPGPLNDSSGRYAMFAKEGPEAGQGSGDLLRLFSGGPGGPDSTFEAVWSLSMGGFGGTSFRWPYDMGEILDANGDGWSDVMFGDYRYPIDSWRWGIAVILSGGPYIPRDSLPPSAIVDLSREGHAAAITIWPIPVTDVLHIAWRGDLKRSPARLEVYDSRGTRVAARAMDAPFGSDVWPCSDLPAGAYYLRLLDRASAEVGTIPFMKQ